MRYITALAFIVGLAAVPAAQAQQAVTPRFAEQPIPRLQTADTAPTSVELRPSRTSASALEVNTEDAAVARELAARTVLTIIGAIVVIVAVVSLVL